MNKLLLSDTVIKVSVAMAAAGAVVGLVSYLNRSSVIEKHIAGSNAIAAHVVIAVIAALAVIGLTVYQKAHKKPQSLLLAPFSRVGFERLKMTLKLQPRVSALGIIRFIFTVPLCGFFLFFFFRSGMQLTGALDPNFVINGWGGPSYLGASLAHWMDGAILFYIEAGLLSLIMVRPDKNIPKA